MILLIYFITTLFALYSYFKGRYVAFVFAYCLVLSHFWGFGPKPLLKSEDFALLVIVPILLANRKLLDSNGDKVAIWCKRLMLYLIVVSAANVLLGLEDIYHTILLLRFLFVIYLSYFVFRSVPMKAVEKAALLMFGVSVIAGVFWYLQFAGVFGIYGGYEEDVVMKEPKNFYNVPILSPAVLFYLCFGNVKIRFRLFFIIFFFGMIVGCMSRGYIIANLASFVIYVIFVLRSKRYVPYLFVGVVVVMALSVQLSHRFSTEGSVGDGIFSEAELSWEIMRGKIPVRMLENNTHNGTGVFRVMMVREKLDYMSQSPIMILFGGGAVHDYSPYIQRYNFLIGNTDKKNDGTEHVHQIDTIDIAFITNVFRYGFVYLIIYIVILFKMWNNIRCAKGPFFVAGFGMFSANILQALGTARLELITTMFFVILIASQASKYQLNINSNEHGDYYS